MADEDVATRLARAEQALARLADEREIRDLISRYCYCADAKRDEQLLELFTEDAEMASAADGVARGSLGRGRIREQVADPTGHHRPDLYGQGMHLLGHNLVIAFDDTTDPPGEMATASSYSLLVLKRGGDLVVYSASSNQWSLRRVDGRWRIAARHRRPIADGDFGGVLLVMDQSSGRAE
jgi:SnoaL-like domain